MTESPSLATVTIDGPSGGGKSTVSRQLAARLGFTYLDTGAMYRAVAWACSQAGVSMDDEAAVAALVEALDIELLAPREGQDDVEVRVNGRMVGPVLRSAEMGPQASLVSKQRAVRARLTALSRQLGEAGQVVAEGRDTGTVVFPRAAWKFYLFASAEERARRRAAQLEAKGEVVDLTALKAQIEERDQEDSNRSLAPLRPAQDAVLIDSTKLGIAEVVARMLEHIRNHPLAK